MCAQGFSCKVLSVHITNTAGADVVTTQMIVAVLIQGRYSLERTRINTPSFAWVGGDRAPSTYKVADPSPACSAELVRRLTGSLARHQYDT